MSEKHPHTPGPWILDGFEVSGEISGAAICRVLEADDFPCVEEGTEADVQAECEANARLVAAAPDLLEALRKLMALNDNRGTFGGELYQDRVDRAWDEARAALAKAEGRTP